MLGRKQRCLGKPSPGNLNPVHFLELDDRAFGWCFDGSSISVSLSWDTQTRSVCSDGGCTGAKGGLQDQFVSATYNIDQIVNSGSLGQNVKGLRD